MPNKAVYMAEYVRRALRVFPCSFINAAEEIILEPTNNIYFRLDDVTSELDFKCKMFAWVSRPIAKGLSNHWSRKVLKSFNIFFFTEFTIDDMYEIYDRLGNDVNRKLTISFIESNFDMKLLERRSDNASIQR